MILYILFSLLGFFCTLSAEDNACNNKYKNLLKLENIFKDDTSAKIPPFISISSESIEQHLEEVLPGFHSFYREKIKKLELSLNAPRSRSWWHTLRLSIQRWRSSFSNSQDTWVHRTLQDQPYYLQAVVENTFKKRFSFTNDEKLFFENAEKAKTLLMVRSSGLEDSKTTANAGLYASIAYVDPSETYIIENAIGKVVSSYFNPQALTNNIMAGLDLQIMPLCIPVLIQQLIGEPFGGTTNPSEIPVSGVAFTTQSNLSTDKFRITEINASYGHGEGIVANRVSVDRYYVTPSKTENDSLNIYSMINAKQQRLVSMKSGVGNAHTLALIKNPDEFITKPCLSTSQIKTLYGVLQKIEIAYKQPMDVEFVIQNGTIYIVQARPAMKFEQKPSYIPDSVLTEKQRGSAIPVNTIVSGASHVCIVTDPNRIIIKDTLDEADADERRSSAQAVFVQTWASSLSHAAVNFIGFGIPCFYVQNLSAIKNLLPSISTEQPLIIDTQRQLVYLWNNEQKSAAASIISGWYEHPISRSLSLVDGIDSYRLVREAAVVPQDAVLIKKMTELKNILGSADQEQIFNTIVERLNDRIRVTEKRMRTKPNICDAVCVQNFTAFKKQLTSIINAFRHAINENAERLELLFYHKMLEALLYQTNDEFTGINQYTYRWFLDDLFLKQALAGSLKVSTDLNTLLGYGQYCPGQELVAGWRTFIKHLDSLITSAIIDQEEIQTLSNMLMLLEKIDAVSLWFATIFYQQMPQLASPGSNPEKRIREMLQPFNNEYSPSNQHFIMFIQSIHTNNAIIKAAMHQKLDTIPAVEAFWKEVHQLLIDPLTTDQFRLEFTQAPFLGKLLMCKELIAVIDVIDESIKLIKSSRALSFDDRKVLFKTMLNDFLNLCKKWFGNLMPIDALEYNSSWHLSGYLEKMTDLFDSIFKEFNSEDEVKFFQKSPSFSVQAAILGSKTAFERHYPATPEDMFMLIHQNSLIAVAATYKSLFSEKPLSDLIYMPQKIRTIIEFITHETIVRKSLIGLTYNDKEIVISYNVPLNNHSATFQISYSFITQDITFHAQYLGEARTRWEQIAVVAATSSELSGLSLEDPIILDIDGGMVSWKWKIRTQNDALIIMNYMSIMNQLSFQDISNISLEDVNKTSDSTTNIFIKTYPQFSKIIKGTLLQDWLAKFENGL